MSSLETRTVHFFFKFLESRHTPQSVHQMACRFGDEGFEPEMKELVGGSEPGLREFLFKYPSIFVFRNAKFMLNSYMYASRDDYSPNEGVEYFSNILKTYRKETAKVANLYGHIGQAPEIVRHFCGLNRTGFSQFIDEYPEFFFRFDDFEDGSDMVRLVQLALNPSETWSEMVTRKTAVIDDIDDCLEVVNSLKDNQIVSLDCEGIMLGKNGRISLIQIGDESGNTFIFDLIECPEMIHYGGLDSLLLSEAVVKVIHDCRNDSINLYQQFGIKLNNVFDTQAGNAVLEYQNNDTPVDDVGNVSLNTLYERYHAPSNKQKNALKDVYQEDYAFWTKRPLTSQMKLYAAADVMWLVTHVYNQMIDEISEDLEPLAWELSDEQVDFYINPQEVKKKRDLRCIEHIGDMLDDWRATGSIPLLTNKEMSLLKFVVTLTNLCPYLLHVFKTREQCFI